MYEFKLGTTAKEADEKINAAFGQGCSTIRTAYRWYQKFRNGDESLEEHEGRGRHSDVDEDKLRDVVEEDPHKGTREIAKVLGVSHNTAARHLKEIGKTKKLERWVPHELSEEQRNRRYEISSALLLRNETDPFLDRIVTCDEKWIMYDNRRRSAQWVDSDESPKVFAKPELHQKKVMVTVWWCSLGIIHHSFLPPGESITAEKYCIEIEEMMKKLKDIRPALVNRRRVLLLHDNARPHVARMTLQKLNELSIETLPHPPFSPDLSPTDYHFFKHLGDFLVGKIFKYQQDAESAFEDFVNSRTSDFYATGIKKLVSRWQRCVESEGFYFD